MNKQKQSSTATDGGRKLKNDILFISILLAVLIVAGLGFYFLRPAGDSVVVTVNKELYGTYPLDQDTVVEIHTGDNGEQINRMVIKDGQVYVESANCRHGICVGRGEINKVGQSIVCLSHKVFIKVTSGQESEGPDITV